jgi:hypothetical protein
VTDERPTLGKVTILLLVLGAVGGCGGSQRIPHGVITRTVPVAVSSPSPAPGDPQAIGRPRSRPASPVAKRSAHSFPDSAGESKFRFLANDVCRTVRAGAPSVTVLGVATSSLRSYAERALVPARRTAVSLERLPTPPALRSTVNHLIRDYQDLAVLYAAAAHVTRAVNIQGSVAALRIVEQRATGQAVAAGLPGCAPHGPA